MKFLLRMLPFYFCLSFVFAQECESLKRGACAMNPGWGESHVYIKINFKDDKAKQVVYLDQYCKERREFTPSDHIKNFYGSSLNQDFIFTLCVNGKLINNEKVTPGSESDISIECNIDEKLICKKHVKKKSFWD